MSNPIERACPFYVNDVKIGEVMSGSFDVDPGVTMQEADDQTAFALGRVKCKSQITSIIPTSGMKTNLMAILIGQIQCSIQIYIGGAYMAFDGIMSGGSVKWDHSKGTCDGSWSFEGVSPTPQ